MPYGVKHWALGLFSHLPPLPKATLYLVFALSGMVGSCPESRMLLWEWITQKSHSLDSHIAMEGQSRDLKPCSHWFKGLSSWIQACQLLGTVLNTLESIWAKACSEELQEAYSKLRIYLNLFETKWHKKRSRWKNIRIRVLRVPPMSERAMGSIFNPIRRWFKFDDFTRGLKKKSPPWVRF